MNNRKNSQRAERVKEQLDAGSIAKHFPDVSNIVVRMEYSQTGIRNALQRTVHFAPSSYAVFKISCLNKDCTSGGFDLTRAITSMIKKRRESGDGKLICGGNGKADDHSQIVYEISISYSRKKSS